MGTLALSGLDNFYLNVQMYIHTYPHNLQEDQLHIYDGFREMTDV